MKTRFEKKARAKEIKRMSDTALDDFLRKMCLHFYTDTILITAVEVLHDEFKFGPVRQQKFIDELDRRMYSEN